MVVKMVSYIKEVWWLSLLYLGFAFENGQIASGEKVVWFESPESLIKGSEIGTFSIETSTAALSHLEWIVKQVASSIRPLRNNK